MCSCSKRQNNVHLMTELRNLRKMDIKFPINDLIKLKANNTNIEYPFDLSDLKLVVFSDSAECNLCAINKMYEWNDYITLSSKSKGKFSVYFIISCTAQSLPDVKAAFYNSGLHTSIYIDIHNSFYRLNPEFPSERMFHTFLLDENNHIILVGNPLHNSNVKVLLTDILEDRIGDLSIISPN